MASTPAAFNQPVVAKRTVRARESPVMKLTWAQSDGSGMEGEAGEVTFNAAMTFANRYEMADKMDSVSLCYSKNVGY